VAISEGTPATLSEVTVQGNRTTRSDLVQRIAGLQTPQRADAGRIREAPQRLRRSGLFASVQPPVLYRASGGSSVGVVLHVEEAERRNNVFGAFGIARDRAAATPISLAPSTSASTTSPAAARDLRVAWQRDARLGSRLRLGYHERYLFGSPVDLGLDLSQTVRDSTSTWQTVDVAGSLPINRTLSLEGGGALDRSVYHLEPPATRCVRAAASASASRACAARPTATRFGTVDIHAEWARRRQRSRRTSRPRHGTRQPDDLGRAFRVRCAAGVRHALAARGEWHVLDGGGAPVPESELYEFGGAQSLRGYREGQFRGDRVAYGGIEYRYGNPLGARVYTFFDAGIAGRRLGQRPVGNAAPTGGTGSRPACSAAEWVVRLGVRDRRGAFVVGGQGARLDHSELLKWSRSNPQSQTRVMWNDGSDSASLPPSSPSIDARRQAFERRFDPGAPRACRAHAFFPPDLAGADRLSGAPRRWIEPPDQAVVFEDRQDVVAVARLAAGTKASNVKSKPKSRWVRLRS
jgi:hypothetical protein